MTHPHKKQTRSKHRNAAATQWGLFADDGIQASAFFSSDPAPARGRRPHRSSLRDANSDAAIKGLLETGAGMAMDKIPYYGQVGLACDLLDLTGVQVPVASQVCEMKRQIDGAVSGAIDAAVGGGQPPSRHRRKAPSNRHVAELNTGGQTTTIRGDVLTPVLNPAGWGLNYTP